MSMIQKNRIGLMGGTFDPIHYGHLFIAEFARCKFSLDKVVFIPAGNPVHKKRNEILDPVHRTEMTRLAVESNPFFELSSVEVERTGPTYTVDTLEQLHNENGGSNDYYFVTGADAILEILTWRNVARVFDLCNFIAITRPGYSLHEMNTILLDLTPQQREKISFFETGGIMVSSTEIRDRVKARQPIKYLVPEKVEDYIMTHQLYS